MDAFKIQKSSLKYIFDFNVKQCGSLHAFLGEYNDFPSEDCEVKKIDICKVIN